LRKDALRQAFGAVTAIGLLDNLKYQLRHTSRIRHHPLSGCPVLPRQESQGADAQPSAAAATRFADIASCLRLCETGSMERDQVIAALKAHEREIRAAGVLSLSLFGSVARGEESAHDVDLAARLGEDFSSPGLAYLQRLEDLEAQLAGILGCRVDVIEEPVRKRRFQTEIDRDRAVAF